jgi:hypothetical protein
MKPSGSVGFLANGTMPKRRHHSGICEQPECSLLFEVENYGSLLCIATHVGDEAVVASCGAAHDAGVATDHQRALGSDGDGSVWLVHFGPPVVSGCRRLFLFLDDMCT